MGRSKRARLWKLLYRTGQLVRFQLTMLYGLSVAACLTLPADFEGSQRSSSVSPFGAAIAKGSEPSPKTITVRSRAPESAVEADTPASGSTDPAFTYTGILSVLAGTLKVRPCTSAPVQKSCHLPAGSVTLREGSPAKSGATSMRSPIIYSSST